MLIIFFCSCKQIDFTFLKDSFLRWRKMLILGKALLFYFLVFLCILLRFCLSIPPFPWNSVLYVLLFLPPVCPLHKEAIPPWCYCYRDSNLFSMINLRIPALHPPLLFFLVATGDRLDVGSSGSEKPSVAQRIVISHYFITYLLLSMIELRLSGTVRKLLFIVHTFGFSLPMMSYTQAFESSSKLHSIKI